MKKLISAFANLNILVGVILILSPMTYLIFSEVFNFETGVIKANDVAKENEILAQDLVGGNSLVDISKNNDINLSFDIPSDKAIDYGSKLKVPSIGIDTTVYESYNQDAALDAGVWRMPFYGTPDDTSTPTVLAAHRWGQAELDWKVRNQHRFLNLTHVKVGDIIELAWNGEEYKYRITAYEESTYLTRTDDLILFTCKYLESPVRIIVYAEQV
jgi:LPXTG-site transpeptidase (sortase) family protein